MKKILFLIFLILFSVNSVFAQMIPVKITPTETISTHHDEVEIGDWIHFKVVTDVYKNEKLYIKKDTPVIGIVDFIHENGFAGDSAEIQFKKFITKNANGEKIVIDYDSNINGNNLRNNDVKSFLALILTGWIRGSEILIEPESKTFNLFIK